MSGIEKSSRQMRQDAASMSRTARMRPATTTLSNPESDAAVPLGHLLRAASQAVSMGLPSAVWVVAAVAAVKPARGGHSVELVEPDVSRSVAGLLRTYLSDNVTERMRRSTGLAISATDLVGMTIVVNVTTELHPRWGLSGRVLALGPGIEQSIATRLLEVTVARLRREGLLDRQRLLPAPRDVTRVAVVHPPAAAGWADIARELSRWTEAGLIAVQPYPTAFEGQGAAAGIAAAVARATAVIGDARPDLVLTVRGGGAATSLGVLDDEALARTIAGAPVPVITGLGHASDGKTLADRVAAHAVDTPSKALALVRDLIATPARRARADYAAILAAVSAAVDRPGPKLAALERLATAEALRQVETASQRLDHGWSAVREAAESTRGRLDRSDDTLDRMAEDVASGSKLVIAQTASELAALMETIRARARRHGERADDGTRHLAIAAERGASLVDMAGLGLAAAIRTAEAAAIARLERAPAELDALARAALERGKQHVARADEGTAALGAIESAVGAALYTQDVAITRLREAIGSAVARRVEATAFALDRVLATLDGADPVHVLRHGYALVTDGQGRVVTSFAAAQAAATLILTFADGTLVVRPTQP